MATPFRRAPKTGRRRLVRHGHLPEREIMTGIGPVKRVRAQTGSRPKRARAPSAFRSQLIDAPAAFKCKRSKGASKLLIPVLYRSEEHLHESMNFGPKGAGGLARAGRRTACRCLDRGAVSPQVWAETSTAKLAEAGSVGQATMSTSGPTGIHVLGPASRTDAQCLLVIIGATPVGLTKELVGLSRRGAPEFSAQSQAEVAAT